MRVKSDHATHHLKRQYLLAAAIPTIIAVVSIMGFVWAQKAVTVVVDGETRHVRTQADDVESLLAEAHVEYEDGDLVTPGPDAPLSEGSMVVVRHAIAVKLELGGSKETLDVVGETVADALVAAGIDPTANPTVEPSLETSLAPGMTVSVPDVFVRVVTEEITVTAPAKTKRVSSLPKGRRQVVTTASPGRVLKVYRVLVSNGIAGPKSLSAQRVVVPPVAEVVAIGTASAPVAVARAKPRSRKILAPPVKGAKMRVTATGYSPEQPDLDDVTATGARATRGVIAVDPRVIPLGTRVYVPGYGYAVAADVGGGVKGAHIDLCFDTVREALNWGRRTVTITIVE